MEGSLDVGTSILRVFALDVYALFDPRDTIYFVTPYIEFQYSVSPQLSQNLSKSQLQLVT